MSVYIIYNLVNRIDISNNFVTWLIGYWNYLSSTKIGHFGSKSYSNFCNFVDRQFTGHSEMMKPEISSPDIESVMRIVGKRTPKSEPVKSRRRSYKVQIDEPLSPQMNRVGKEVKPQRMVGRPRKNLDADCNAIETDLSCKLKKVGIFNYFWGVIYTKCFVFVLHKFNY